MRMAALMSRISKGLGRRSSFKTQQSQKFVTQYYQPWKRAFGTAIGVTEASGFKVDVRSREMIKPSSPTPDHNNTVRISLIDQLATCAYMPFLLFYKNNPLESSSSSIEGRSALLKKSLSQTLVDYYPLAGRIKGNELIECIDQGVEFCEAHLSENLSKFIESPSLDDLQALLPFRELFSLQDDAPRNKNIVLSVQVNHFSCGGTAIAMCLHHKIGDAASVATFLRAWAARAQGDVVDGSQHILLRPKFNGASLFPPVKLLNEPTNVAAFQSAVISKERIAMRRLIFDREAIKELKAQAIAVANTSIIRPTRVEVVTAFICKHWPNKICSTVQVVNLRKRMVPPVPEDFFGNCAWYARASEYRPETIIQEIRKGIEKISGNNELKDLFTSGETEFMSRLIKEMGAVFEGPEKLIASTSVSGLPFYEVNFGMGKPVWACVAVKLPKNGVLMTSSACGKGIEAWVSMLEDDISKFDHSLSKLPYPVSKPLEIGSSPS